MYYLDLKYNNSKNHTYTWQGIGYIVTFNRPSEFRMYPSCGVDSTNYCVVIRHILKKNDSEYILISPTNRKGCAVYMHIFLLCQNG